MLQQEQPEDFVIATGEQHSVREFAEIAGDEIGMRLEWEGEGIGELGVDRNSGRVVTRIDTRYLRPAEVDSLLGDASKAREAGLEAEDHLRRPGPRDGALRPCPGRKEAAAGHPNPIDEGRGSQLMSKTALITGIHRAGWLVPGALPAWTWLLRDRHDPSTGGHGVARARFARDPGNASGHKEPTADRGCDW